MAGRVTVIVAMSCHFVMEVDIRIAIHEHVQEKSLNKNVSLSFVAQSII